MPNDLEAHAANEKRQRLRKNQLTTSNYRSVPGYLILTSGCRIVFSHRKNSELYFRGCRHYYVNNGWGTGQADTYYVRRGLASLQHLNWATFRFLIGLAGYVSEFLRWIAPVRGALELAFCSYPQLIGWPATLITHRSDIGCKFCWNFAMPLG